jgi:hypothetical protein
MTRACIYLVICDLGPMIVIVYESVVTSEFEVRLPKDQIF